MKQLFGILLACVLAGPVLAQSGPLRLTITDGVIEPLPFAVPTFQAETAAILLETHQSPEHIFEDKGDLTDIVTVKITKPNQGQKNQNKRLII